MNPRDAAAQARLLAFFEHAPVGTRVTARRDHGRPLQTVTMGEAFRTSDGLAVIRLQAVPGNYPLDHVSFGWDQEPMRAPAVAIADALDHAPAPPLTVEGAFTLSVIGAVMIYLLGNGLYAFGVWWWP